MSIPQQDVYDFNPRHDVAPYLPPGVRSALDVGCGAGGFGTTLRAAYGVDARLVGVEPVASQAMLAKEHFDDVLEGFFPDALPAGERFDLIAFNDVLEHMVDPWTALRLTHRHLTQKGVVVAAIPNIQFAPAVEQIRDGHFDYADAGIFDRTHLRFFTRSTMIELFESSGFRVRSTFGINSAWHFDWFTSESHSQGVVATARRKATSLRRHRTIARRPDSEWQQFVIVAERVAELVDEAGGVARR